MYDSEAGLIELCIAVIVLILVLVVVVVIIRKLLHPKPLPQEHFESDFPPYQSIANEMLQSEESPEDQQELQ